MRLLLEFTHIKEMFVTIKNIFVSHKNKNSIFKVIKEEMNFVWSKMRKVFAHISMKT